MGWLALALTLLLEQLRPLPLRNPVYALAGTMDFDFEAEALGQDGDGNDVFLRDIWPAPEDVERTIAESINKEMFTEDYADVFAGDDRWRSLPTPEGIDLKSSLTRSFSRGLRSLSVRFVRMSRTPQLMS